VTAPRSQFDGGLVTLYGIACWAVFCLLGTFLWPAVMVLPRLSWRWSLARAMGRLACGCLAIDFETRGVLVAPEPSVYVANHASFLDACVLFVMFPTPVVFVAGGVLSRQRIVGPFLRRIGAVFVTTEVGHGRSNVEEALSKMEKVLRSGRSLVFFPEGGLEREPGLRRFHLGAFVVAVATGCPVIPVGIIGTREILPAGRRMLRPGALCLTVGQPIRPNGSDRKAARQLANLARAAIEGLLTES